MNKRFEKKYIKKMYALLAAAVGVIIFQEARAERLERRIENIEGIIGKGK